MRCRFKHKIFQNEENGYTIAIFTTQDTSVPLSARDKYLASRNIIGFSAIGFGLPLTDEIELEMEGRWESGEHGTQYQVENFMEVVPRTKEGILGYLSSGAIKGIGPKMADTIFRKFGLQTLEIMENNPQELLKIRGISEKKLAAIVESYGKNQVFRELMTFLAPFKVTPKKVNMILKKFGNESVDIIRHRPYMLSAVKGFGFLTVDAIGRQCCCALNDPMRISGCIGHIMNQAMKEGHLFKQRQEVIREALEMLNRDLQVMAVSEQDVSQVLYRLVLQKSIVVEEERIYSIRQYEEETQTASMIARRLLEKPVLLSIEPELEKAQKTLGITLSETQKQAVRMVFAHPIPKCIPFRSTFRKEGLYLKKVTHTVLKYTNKSVDILGHGKEKCGCRYMDITVPVQRSSILTVAYRKLSGTVTSMRWHLRIFLRIRRQVRTLTDPDIPFWWRMS